ncbi:DUF3429 family protein [Spiribacter halobius]|nr:DUF3429 family protein [Spiribacter halobius]UEX79100.1 DUF3429 family protein [Spiribacter halobius]
MSADGEIVELARSAPVVVFHSPVTDLAGLDQRLDQAGLRWRAVELGMGDSDNRARFQALKALTGSGTLPQVFMDGRYVGGLREAMARLDAGTPRRGAPAAAAWMGYLGLLPFAAGALGVWFGPAWVAGWLAAYGAVILSFVGAVHWGLAVADARPAPETFYASVVPALVGWAALLVPVIVALPVLAAAFVLWRYWEYQHARTTLPRWFRRLRTALTVGAAASLAIAWPALLPLSGG